MSRVTSSSVDDKEYKITHMEKRNDHSLFIRLETRNNDTWIEISIPKHEMLALSKAK